jgi:hypothetical protein
MLEQKRQDFETNTPATGDVVHAQLGSLLSAIQISMIPARAELSQEEPRLQSPQLPHRIKNVEAEPADTGKDKSDG